MPKHSFARPRGRFEEVTLRSERLADNLLGDPAERTVVVYLPEGYDEDEARRYPLFVDLVGYTGSGLWHAYGWKAFWENVPQRLDRLVAEGRMGPVVCAFPDAFTALGGNQYVDSLAMGRWASFLTEEMLPALEQRYRLLPGRAHRALFGKSSGGYGALWHGMHHAEHWGAVACHSGDMAFDLVYGRDLPKLCDAMARHGGLEPLLTHLLQTPALSGDEFHVLMLLAMAASYDPDPQGPMGVRLPVDPERCEIIEARWAAWLAHDPLTAVERPQVQDALGSLRGLFVDCGFRDQYFLHYGARRLRDRLAHHGIAHHYEEFDGTHSGIDHRMDVSLPWLYERVAG